MNLLFQDVLNETKWWIDCISPNFIMLFMQTNYKWNNRYTFLKNKFNLQYCNLFLKKQNNIFHILASRSFSYFCIHKNSKTLNCLLKKREKMINGFIYINKK